MPAETFRRLTFRVAVGHGESPGSRVEAQASVSRAAGTHDAVHESASSQFPARTGAGGDTRATGRSRGDVAMQTLRASEILQAAVDERETPLPVLYFRSTYTRDK